MPARDTRPAPLQSTQRWRFGPFQADAAEHRLLRDGQVVPVTRKSFALLACLLGRPGRLFTKAELFDTVWAGSVVTDAALSRAIRELRVALGDDASAPRYIATAHGLGFRFVALVAADGPIGEPAEPGAPPADRSLLVGRERELAGLGAALAKAGAGQRQLVFVTGEAGIGKSALVQAFIAGKAGHAELCVAAGRCIEQYGNSEAYLPILEALESLARQLGAGEVRDVLLRYAPAWLAQLPWLAHDADPAVLQRALADTTAQRMLREIAQALEVLAASRPIILWLEDLHWSDPSSLAVVSFLAGRREPARLLLIASFRPADARAGTAPLHSLAHQLVQRGQACELALDPLDAGAVASYLRARFDGAAGLAADELGAFVHRRTDGNALFTVAIVDDLVRRRSLTRSGGAWSLAGPVSELGIGLPDDLRHLVHDQIERLPEDDRRLIEAAAVAGTDFSAAALAAALQADTAQIEDRCARLAQQGRFFRARATAAASWPDGTVSAGFGFLHALYWQGTYEQVPQARRAEWNRRIGLRQEQAHGAQCAPIATELAMRFEAARDTERSLRYLQMAGSGALARCAYPECVGLLQHALTLVPELPLDQQARCELDLLLPLGAALMAVQGYASTEVEAAYQRALVLCRTCGKPGDLERVLRGLWNVVFSRADLGRARAAAQELLDLASARQDPGLNFDALGKLGHTCLHSGNFPEARSYLERALSLPALPGDATWLRERPRLLACLSWALWYTGHPAQASARADEAMALVGAAAGRQTSAYVLGYTSMLHGLRGEGASLLALARQQRVLSAQHGLEYWRAWSGLALGWGEMLCGDARAGAATLNRAISEMRELGTVVGISGPLCLLAEAELAAGRPDRASAALTASSDILHNDGNVRHAAEHARLQGEVALAMGSGREGHALAERSFASALAIACRQGARSLELRAATSLARLWADRGQPQRAADVLAPIYASFNEGLETADLVRAKALLEDLARQTIARP